METNKRNLKVDVFIERSTQWKKEFIKLREIVSACPITEELKWGVPCYTYNNGNVVIIHGFKEYCALLFIKGSLLNDTQGVLIQQTQNVQAGRQIRFTKLDEIVAIENTIKDYINQAIEIEKAGLVVDFKKSTDYKLPDELISKFDEHPNLKTAFEALTPGRQRAYILYFSNPKQAKTRESRVEKSIDFILDGKGLNE